VYDTVLEELIHYSNDIIADRITSCKKHKKACQRFLDDLDRMEYDTTFNYFWDEEEAQKVVKWFRYQKHSKGVLAGEPIELVAFQKFLVCNIEAWKYNDEENRRRFKYAYIQLARKNSKSQLEAGMSTYEAYVKDCSGVPEIYTLGVERDQAKIVFDEINLMMSKPVRKKFKITKPAITCKKNDGFIKHLSKKAGKTGDGKNPQMAIIDEYHAHPNSDMNDVMLSGMVARRDPLIVIITTAGVDFEDKPCYAEYKYCTNILNQTITNENYFVLICELDEDDDPKDESCWMKANPIVCSYKEGLDSLRQDCKLAFDSEDPEKIRKFKTKNCNIWVKFRETKFLDIDYWHECRIDESILEKFRGCECYGGFDLSKTGDLTSLSLEFPFIEEETGDQMYALYSHSFIPEESMNTHKKTDGVPYDDWINKGWLTATTANLGLIVDYWEMIYHLERLQEEYDLNIKTIGYDPHSASLLVAELEARGFDMVEIRQSCAKLDTPTVNLRDVIKARQVIQDGNQLLAWSFDNAETDTNSFGEIKLSKRSTFKRIDPAASCVFSHQLAMQHWNDDSLDINDATDEYLKRMGWDEKEV
jgi:phage terminase large subunit-like protein